ncbi:MAG: hypothetical protein H6704_29910 [Myxococcales bacterium]|nr:hypothetical protein [Myxococcales bacterium]
MGAHLLGVVARLVGQLAQLVGRAGLVVVDGGQRDAALGIVGGLGAEQPGALFDQPALRLEQRPALAARGLGDGGAQGAQLDLDAADQRGARVDQPRAGLGDRAITLGQALGQRAGLLQAGVEARVGHPGQQRGARLQGADGLREGLVRLGQRAALGLGLRQRGLLPDERLAGVVHGPRDARAGGEQDQQQGEKAAHAPEFSKAWASPESAGRRRGSPVFRSGRGGALSFLTGGAPGFATARAAV